MARTSYRQIRLAPFARMQGVASGFKRLRAKIGSRGCRPVIEMAHMSVSGSRQVLQRQLEISCGGLLVGRELDQLKRNPSRRGELGSVEIDRDSILIHILNQFVQTVAHLKMSLQ